MKLMRYISFGILSAIVTGAVAEDKTVCHESPSYLVVEGPTGEVGTNFLVKYKSKTGLPIKCEYAVRDGDFEIKNEWAEYFLALQNNLLILDSGTGPDPRGLVIWNLENRKKVYSGTYSEPYEVKPGYLEFWTETAKATEDNCPEKKEWEAGGLGAGIDTRVTLSLADFSVTRSSQTRCSSRQ